MGIYRCISCIYVSEGPLLTLWSTLCTHIKCGQVQFVEDREHLVLEGRVDGPVLVVHPSLLSVFVEDSLLLCWRCLCWDVCRSAWVGQEDEGGSRYLFILFGREDEAEVAVLASAEVAFNGRRVRHQELMVLLDDGVVRIAKVLG